jgi:uroporphyrinogen decarboxylase
MRPEGRQAGSGPGSGLAGLVVVAFESRRAAEIGQLIAHHGGEAVSAPSMREVPLEENPDALRWVERLLAGGIDVHVCLTGVGTRALAKLVSSRVPLPDLVSALARTVLVARGPKPVAALRELGLVPTLVVPEPNTWRELLAALDAHAPVAGKRVSIQEYGLPNLALLDGLDERGADVQRVPVYAWALPLDAAPLRAAVARIARGGADVVVFTNAQQVSNVLHVAAEDGAEADLRRALPRLVVGSIGPTCSEALRGFGLPVDLEPSHPKMGTLLFELASAARGLLDAKRGGAARVEVVSPRPAPAADARLANAPVMRAFRREPAPFTPVWLMRQAGRYLPEYRKLRAKVGLLELCKTPDLACAVTVEAVQRLGVDAAIVFSDLLVLLEPMGARLSYVAGEGPVIANPVRESEDVERLPEVPADALGFVYEAVRLARAALPAGVPLLGFAGAPFTLAGYLIEGGASRNYEHTKLFMYREPRVWHVLLEKLVRAAAACLIRQVAAGAQAVQVFDPSVGCLSPEDYRELVLPHTRRLMALVREAAPGTPIVYFGTGCASLLESMRDAGPDVLGLDWRVDLGEAWARLGAGVAVQGNLDPAVLFAEPVEIRRRAARILAAAGGRPGHVFNLGHGVLQQTPVDHVRALVDFVHSAGDHVSGRGGQRA